MTKKLLVGIALTIILAIIVSGVSVAASEQLNNEEINVESVLVATTEETETVPEVIIIHTEDENKEALESKVARCNINVRYSPSIESDIYKIIDRGTPITYLDRKDGWGEVIVDGNKYYISVEYLVTEEEWEELSKIPYSSEVPLSQDLQRYLWNECQDLGIKYAFALAVMDVETGGTFNPNLISKTNDWGIMQVNKCWHKKFKEMGYITCSEDLLNPYNGIHCGLWILNLYTSQFGSVERSYAAYNTGKTSIQSNKNSREVMRRYEKWKAILGDI